ncbi:MAG: IS1595 family transposase [Crocinitomicaceae bacterium]|jgi:transposase-like protein
MHLLQVTQNFKTEKECHEYLINIRWKGKIQCVYCESDKVYKRSYGNGLKCRSCNKSFTVTTGTIFHSTKLPLLTWFMAITQILSAKKGISSLQLARVLKINKNTAWYMQSRLRKVMKTDIIMQGIVEVDETYIGGNLGNMHKKQKEKRNPYKSGMTHKVPILGMITRDTGKVHLEVLPHANGENIKPILFSKIDSKSSVITDGFGGYSGIGKYFEEHIKMNHEKKIWNIENFSLSKIEGFFTLIKRAVFGQYHKISKKHIQSYMDEIAFKQNYSNENAWDALINRACAF